MREKKDLSHSLQKDLPRHVAIIMDGNGRWARRHGYSRIKGHRQGVKTVDKVVDIACDMGLECLTLYTFSVQNWSRPKGEVRALMNLLAWYLEKKNAELMRKNIRLQVLGDIQGLPSHVRNALARSLELTGKNTGLVLNIALNYGGREEIIQAVRRIAVDHHQGRIGLDDMNEESFSSYLYSRGLPDPDLLVRTSGENRISNFLLWQTAYTEFYVTEVLWPDFSENDFMDAVRAFQKRDRRFGSVRRV